VTIERCATGLRATTCAGGGRCRGGARHPRDTCGGSAPPRRVTHTSFTHLADHLQIRWTRRRQDSAKLAGGLDGYRDEGDPPGHCPLSPAARRRRTTSPVWVARAAPLSKRHRAVTDADTGDETIHPPRRRPGRLQGANPRPPRPSNPAMVRARRDRGTGEVEVYLASTGSPIHLLLRRPNMACDELPDRLRPHAGRARDAERPRRPSHPRRPPTSSRRGIAVRAHPEPQESSAGRPGSRRPPSGTPVPPRMADLVTSPQPAAARVVAIGHTP